MILPVIVLGKKGPLHWIYRTISNKAEFMTSFLSLCWHNPQVLPWFPSAWWRLSEAEMQTTTTSTCSLLLQPETLGSKWGWGGPSQLFLALLALCPGHTDSHIRVHLHNPACDWSQFNGGWQSSSITMFHPSTRQHKWKSVMTSVEALTHSTIIKKESPLQLNWIQP